MRNKRRSPCPIACVLDLLGDKWTLLIVRDMVYGKSLFKEFTSSPEKIATNILSDRLVRLTKQGYIEKYAQPDQVGRVAYRLTSKGESLKPLLNQIVAWGLKHISGTEVRMKPLVKS